MSELRYQIVPSELNVEDLFEYMTKNVSFEKVLSLYILLRTAISTGKLGSDKKVSEKEINNLSEKVELRREIINKDKEIERLKKELEDLEKLNNANYQSFIETNKIMIELEKWLYDRSEFTNFGAVIDKIKELKGSEKE